MSSSDPCPSPHSLRPRPPTSLSHCHFLQGDPSQHPTPSERLLVPLPPRLPLSPSSTPSEHLSLKSLRLFLHVFQASGIYEYSQSLTLKILRRLAIGLRNRLCLLWFSESNERELTPPLKNFLYSKAPKYFGKIPMSLRNHASCVQAFVLPASVPARSCSPWNLVWLRLQVFPSGSCAVAAAAPTARPVDALAGLPVPSQPCLVVPCQSVTSCCPALPALLSHHSSPVHYLDLYCVSPSTDLQQVPINNFKRSPIFCKLQAIMEI